MKKILVITVFSLLFVACQPVDTLKTTETDVIVPQSCQTVPADDANNTPPEENLPPEWAFDQYDSGVTVNDATDDLQTVLDLSTISSDPNGDELWYYPLVVTGVGPNFDETMLWFEAFCVENGVLKVGNLKTANPEIEFLDDSSYQVRVLVSVADEPEDDYSNTIEISWYFDNVQ